MANGTKIEWTDATWNPVTGCTKASPGCAHCYAETMDHRFDHDKAGKLPWAVPAFQGGRGVTLHPERLDQPVYWKKPRRIFVNSMSDLFHEDVPDGFIYDVFLAMAEAQQHTFQVLTKRPERMVKCLPKLRFTMKDDVRLFNRADWTGWPLPNVWLGVSVENQLWADRRIPLLLQTPAEVRFLSVEPLLGPVDLYPWLPYSEALAEMGGYKLARGCISENRLGLIDWIIVGGESGPKARPMHPGWVWQIRDDCQAAGVAFFFKSWGEWEPVEYDQWSLIKSYGVFDSKGIFYRDFCQFDCQHMSRVGKKAAGAMLDGREWREMPR